MEEDDVRTPFYRVVQAVAQRPEKLTSARFDFDVLRTRTAEIKKHDEDQPPQQYVNSNMYTAKKHQKTSTTSSAETTRDNDPKRL